MSPLRRTRKRRKSVVESRCGRDGLGVARFKFRDCEVDIVVCALLSRCRILVDNNDSHFLVIIDILETYRETNSRDRFAANLENH